VDGIDPDSCENELIENSHVRAGDDCVAVYSMQGPTRNVLVRNLTCYTPLSVTHGHDTSNVTFDSCTVYGTWGNDTTGVRPRWFKTATRIKTDRKTNGTLSDITYRNIRGVGVDLMVDITSWYPCHNGEEREGKMKKAY
jgi:polygalacturonase